MLSARCRCCASKKNRQANVGQCPNQIKQGSSQQRQTASESRRLLEFRSYSLRALGWLHAHPLCQGDHPRGRTFHESDREIVFIFLCPPSLHERHEEAKAKPWSWFLESARQHLRDPQHPERCTAPPGARTESLKPNSFTLRSRPRLGRMFSNGYLGISRPRPASMGESWMTPEVIIGLSHKASHTNPHPPRPSAERRCRSRRP